MTEVMNPKERKTTIGGKTLVFRPLMYGNFSRFLGALPKVINEVARKNPNLDLDYLEKHPVGALMMIGDRLLDELLDWLVLSLFDGKKNVDHDWLKENLPMAEFSELVVWFVEDNDIKRVIANFRKLGSVIKKEGSAPNPSSSLI